MQVSCKCVWSSPVCAGHRLDLWCHPLTHTPYANAKRANGGSVLSGVKAATGTPRFLGHPAVSMTATCL